MVYFSTEFSNKTWATKADIPTVLEKVYITLVWHDFFGRGAVKEGEKKYIGNSQAVQRNLEAETPSKKA